MFLDVYIFEFIFLQMWWACWEYRLIFFIKCGKCSFSPFLSLLFWDSYYVCSVMLVGVTQVSEALLIFLHFLFLPPVSINWVISLDLSSSSLTLQLKSWAFVVKFLFQLLYFLGTEIVISSYKIISNSLLILSVCWHIILILSFKYLGMVSFNSLNIFKIANLNSLFLVSPMSGLPHR